MIGGRGRERDEQQSLIKRGRVDIFLLRAHFGHSFKGLCYEMLKIFFNVGKDIYLPSSSP
jgi:hypothetical protein